MTGVYSKMDSFIRSKYESKRWAREGPVPSDPSVLDTGSSAPAAQPEPVAAPPPVSAPPRGHAPTSSVSSARATPVTNRQPQPHQLLSTSMTNRPTAQPAAPEVAAEETVAGPESSQESTTQSKSVWMD